jgi:hypothetical protein
MKVSEFLSNSLYCLGFTKEVSNEILQDFYKEDSFAEKYKDDHAEASSPLLMPVFESMKVKLIVFAVTNHQNRLPTWVRMQKPFMDLIKKYILSKSLEE